MRVGLRTSRVGFTALCGYPAAGHAWQDMALFRSVVQAAVSSHAAAADTVAPEQPAMDSMEIAGARAAAQQAASARPAQQVAPLPRVATAQPAHQKRAFAAFQVHSRFNSVFADATEGTVIICMYLGKGKQHVMN